MTTETLAVPRRDEVLLEYTWDLTTLYVDAEAWEQDITSLEALFPTLSALQGTVGQSAQSLLTTLELRDEVGKRLSRIHTYASHSKDADSTDPAAQALEERAGFLMAKITAALAFIEPEILAIADETITAWQKEEPRLQLYAYNLEELACRRAHVRSTEVEGILAQFSDITRAPKEIFETLIDVDLQFPTIEDANDQPVQLSYARYGRLMESRDRRVRCDTFKGFLGGFRTIHTTLGTILTAEVRTRVLNARMHGYASSLQAALQPQNIPLDVYHNLVATINANLPRLHRYLGLRKRILGIDDQHCYDLYAPLVPEINITVTYPQATATIMAALAPLGPGYCEAVQQAFCSRWIDVYENMGKYSGAYSGGSYTTAPFILLNYQDRLDDLYILAHELGHALHSLFTRRTQPFVYGDYTVFVAEVASTLNEVLLTNYLLMTSDDTALRKHLIVQQLQDVCTVIFRQTMFAEFELDMHTRMEAGEPLTADTLTKRYHELMARYYGAEVILDEEAAFEWARIPHFY